MQGQSTVDWATISAYWTQIAYRQRGHGKSLSIAKRFPVTEPATGISSSPQGSGVFRNCPFVS